MPLGVEEQLEPTPGIFRTKLAAEAYHPTTTAFMPAHNYPSAGRPIARELPQGYRGRPHVPPGRGHYWGLSRLAAIPEGSPTRTIFDATVTYVNEKIRAHTPEKTEAPSIADVRHAMALEHANGSRLTAMKHDVSAAHRRIRIQRNDWRYLTAKCDHERPHVGFRVCGRLPVSAPRRLGAEGSHDSHCPYAHLERTDQLEEDAARQAVAMDRCPHQFTRMDLNYSHTRTNYLNWLTSCGMWRKGRPCTSNRLGTPWALSWCTGVLPHLKAFLTPFFTWIHAVKNAGRPPQKVRVVAQAFREVLQSRVATPCAFYRISPGEGNTDAAASRYRAAVGGWWSDASQPDEMQVQWFAMEVTEENCPWAWESGNPQHKIGALELFANLLLLRMVASHANGQHLCWRAGAKLTIKAMPTACTAGPSKQWNMLAVSSISGQINSHTSTSKDGSVLAPPVDQTDHKYQLLSFDICYPLEPLAGICEI
eukprot:6475323-Amphidinium_carterae.1